MPDAETQLAESIWSRWEELVLESKNVDASLVVVKRKFTEITVTQIGGFGKEIQEFHERFKMEGPGAIGRNLEKGKDIRRIDRQTLVI